MDYFFVTTRYFHCCTVVAQNGKRKNTPSAFFVLFFLLSMSKRHVICVRVRRSDRVVNGVIHPFGGGTAGKVIHRCTYTTTTGIMYTLYIGFPSGPIPMGMSARLIQSISHLLGVKEICKNQFLTATAHPNFFCALH